MNKLSGVTSSTRGRRTAIGAKHGIAVTLAAIAAVGALGACSTPHDPVEEARKAQQIAEGIGHPLSHLPGTPIGDSASDACMKVMQRSADASEESSADIEALTACEDVPSWAYAWRELGGYGIRAGERPLWQTLDIACGHADESAPVCADRDNWRNQ